MSMVEASVAESVGEDALIVRNLQQAHCAVAHLYQ